MKTRRVVFVVLACATCLAIYSFFHSNQKWEATKRNNRQLTLNTAAYGGDLPTVRACVEAGADVNAAPYLMSPDDIHDALPLEQAMKWPQADVVRYLLDHGANPNGARGRNPLIRLCYVGHVGDLGTDILIAKLLLEHGADPNAHEKENRQELTPLKGARTSAPSEMTGKVELIALLQRYGALE